MRVSEVGESSGWLCLLGGLGLADDHLEDSFNELAVTSRTAATVCGVTNRLL